MKDLGLNLVSYNSSNFVLTSMCYTYLKIGTDFKPVTNFKTGTKSTNFKDGTTS